MAPLFTIIHLINPLMCHLAPSDTHVNLVLILDLTKVILTTHHNPTEHLCFHSLPHVHPLVLNMRDNRLTDVIILVDICVLRCV